MKCSFCGKELKEGAKFCFFCGTRIRIDGEERRKAPIAEEIKPVEEAVQPVEIQEAESVEALGETAFEGNAQDTVADVEEQTSEHTVENNFEPLAKEEPVTVAYTETAEGTTENKKRKKKSVIIIAAALAVALLVGAIGGIFALSMGGADYNSQVVDAYVSASGSGYICYGNGKILPIGEGIKEAVLSADRKHVVVLSSDGELYCTDSRAKNRSVIYTPTEGQEIEIMSVCDDTVFFAATTVVSKVVDGEKTQINEISYYRYTYKGPSMLLLGSDETLDSIEFSPSAQLCGKTGAVAVAKDGELKVYVGGEIYPAIVDSYDTSYEMVDVAAVSDDGKAVVWMTADKKSASITVNLWHDGEVFQLESYTGGASPENGFYMSCPESSSDELVIMSGKTLYTLSDDDIDKTKLPEEIASNYAYTLDGNYVFTGDGFDVDEFIVATKSSDGTVSLLLIKYGNEFHKLVSGVETFEIADGRLVYIKNDAMYCAEISGDGELEKQAVIAKGADTVKSIKAIGKYAYYLTDDGTLYRFNMASKKTSTVSNDVAAFTLGKNGKSVFYYVGVKADETTGVRYGMLYKNNEKDGSDLVCRDVILSSATSFLTLGTEKVVDEKQLWIEVFAEGYEGEFKYHSFFYNGKSCNALIQNIREKA